MTDRHAEPQHQPLAWTVAGAVAEQDDDLSDPSRPTRVWISCLTAAPLRQILVD
ncbi:MAG: hypothetical protein KKG78_10060 [Alphaproteobacteria bacterium]|nr:hypothetical protein [Alphaproteobacteria bacterium]